MVDLVLDASSLILLAKTDLLKILSGELNLWITKEIEEESTRKGTYDAKLIKKEIEDGKIRAEEVKKGPVRRIKEDFNLDIGEASAIELYKEMGCDLLVTDDGKAIDTCKVLDVKYTTTLNILVRLAEKGILEEERALAKLEKLEKYGWYKSRLIEEGKSSIRGEKNG